MSTKPPTNSLSFRLAGPEAVIPERSLAFFRENRDFFARWDPPRPPVFYTPERQRQYLLEETAENAAGTALYRYLCRPGEEEILGYLHLTGVEQGPPGPTAELGYKLARSAAGQGLMTAAVRQLLALTGAEKAVVFGDMKNDIPMFLEAAEGYAVANAAPELKAIASGIIGSNREDGVVRWLERYGRRGTDPFK